MGMFDEKQYLTGKSGVVTAGDTFHLHGAGIAGSVRKPDGSGQIPEAFLLISRSGTEDPIRVFTTGAAIVGQIQRMDEADRRAQANTGGVLVRLGQLPQADATRSPAFILEDARSSEDSGRTPNQGSGF